MKLSENNEMKLKNENKKIRIILNKQHLVPKYDITNNTKTCKEAKKKHAQ